MSKPSIEELERILALPAEALKIEIEPNGEIRARTAKEWVPVALRLDGEAWEKLPAKTRREVHDLAADMIKGKGASQGADELMCPMTAQVCYDPRAQCKPGYCRRQLVPEPSGEFVSLAKVKAIINKERIWDAARGQTRRTWAADEILDELNALAASPDEQKG